MRVKLQQVHQAIFCNRIQDKMEYRVVLERLHRDGGLTHTTSRTSSCVSLIHELLPLLLEDEAIILYLLWATLL